MTTSRMGLEQESRLSDDELKRIADDDHVQCGDASAMALELLAYREASKESVAYIVGTALLENLTQAKSYKADSSLTIKPLFMAPPIQDVSLPDGYVLVPIEPTEDMVIDGFESVPSKFFSETDEWEKYEAMSGCQQAAHKAKLCWAAMIAAAPPFITGVVETTKLVKRT